MQNEMIKKAEAAIDAKVPPADKAAYDKIVLAGMKVMFEDKQMHAQLMEGLQQSPDVKTVVDGVIGILGILFKESRNTMPVGPMILAGQSLLMEALDFMEEGGMIEVTPDMLGEATQLYIETLLPMIGMTPEKMKAIMAKAQGVMSDPQKMAQFKQSQGG
jgi:hypothetical protein